MILKSVITMSVIITSSKCDIEECNNKFSVSSVITTSVIIKSFECDIEEGDIKEGEIEGCGNNKFIVGQSYFFRLSKLNCTKIFSLVTVLYKNLG